MSNLGSAQSSDALIYEQIYGALLGAAVGDALGWPNEQNASRVGNRPASPSDTYCTWQRRVGGRFATHEVTIQAGAYSDDTQLLLATARGVLFYSQWATYLSHHELPLWLIYERGGGGATKRAAESWMNGKVPWTDTKLAQRYFHAGGNGVAMRVLPHVLVMNQTATQLMRDVLRNGILTHGHPRALLGARLYALAAWWIAHQKAEIPYGMMIDVMLDDEGMWALPPERSGGLETNSTSWLESADQFFSKGYLQAWKATVDEIRIGLQHCQRAVRGGVLTDHFTTLKELGCFGKENGSGVIAALVAIYLFSVHAFNPMIGMRTIAYARGADTDTIASMLGGMFGLSHRLDWIPDQLREVQDHTLLEHLAIEFTVSKSRVQPTADRWRTTNQHKVLEQLRLDATAVQLGVLGQVHVVHQNTLPPLKNNIPGCEWVLKTTDGQTLYITYMSRQGVESKSAQRMTRTGESLNRDSQRASRTTNSNNPIQEFDQNTNSNQPITLPATTLVPMLEELASLLSYDVRADVALLLVAKILATSPARSTEIRRLVEESLPSISEQDRHKVVFIIERFIGEAKF